MIDEPHALVYLLYETRTRVMSADIAGVYPSWKEADAARKLKMSPDGYINCRLRMAESKYAINFEVVRTE